MPLTKPVIPEHREPCNLPNPESTASFWHSQPSPLLIGHRSTRNLPGKADVVIIGSGVTGASAAYHLLNSEDSGTPKPSVVLLEAREACWGATGRNGGHCQPLLFSHPEEPDVGRFELKNWHTLHDLIKAKNIDCEFVAQPGVQATFSRRQLDRAEHAISIVKDNAPDLASMMQIVTDKDELKALRVPGALGAVKTDIAARLWPYKFVAGILEELLTSAELQPSFNLQTLTPVTKVHKADHHGTVAVETARGIIKAKKVILATNGYTSHLLPEFADLIVPCRGHMSSLLPPPSLANENRLKTSLGVMDGNVDDYLIQRPNETGGHLMFGGGRQEGQSMGITDDSVVEDSVAKYLRRRLITALDLPEGKDASKHVQELTATYLWTGIMGYSRDDRPWVGPVPDLENVYMAAGYTGHGMPNTWLSGKTVALIVRETLAGTDEASAMDVASAETGLPKSYRTSKHRIERAMALDSVDVVDWREMKAGQEEASPPSGYA